MADNATGELGASRSSTRGEALHARIAGAFVILGASYNVLLAWVNAHVLPLNRGHVAAVDAALICAALLLAFIRWRPEMTRWLIMIVSFAILLLLLSLVRGELSPKDFRDVLLIAAFIMLGITLEWNDARRIFVALHLVVLVMLLFELFLPTTYGQALSPASYFVNTRGFFEEQFFGADRFNSIRPDERFFFPQLGWPRAASLFLEPVTFGNYCAFAMLMIVAMWRDTSVTMRIFLIASWALMLVGCDSRFAGLTSLLLLAVLPLLRRSPTITATLYLPVALAIAAIVSNGLAFNPMEDTFPGRIARGLRYLYRLDPEGLAGFSLASQRLADAGVAYLVVEQSVLGVALLLGFLFFQPHLDSPRQRLVLNGMALIFALNMLVSNSILSLKNGAPMWLLVGAAIVSPGPPREKRERGLPLSPARSRDNRRAPERASRLHPTSGNGVA